MNKLNKYGSLLVLSPFASSGLAQNQFWYTRVDDPEPARRFPDGASACTYAAQGYAFSHITYSFGNQYNCFRILDDDVEQGFATLYRASCSSDTFFDPASQACIPKANNNGNSCNNTDSPINTSSGNKFYQTIDYQDANFIVARYYNSSWSRWTFNYQQYLRLYRPAVVLDNNYVGPSMTQGSLDAYRPDGSVVSFNYGNPDIQTYIGDSHQKEALLLTDINYLAEVQREWHETHPPLINHSHDLILTNGTTEQYNSRGRLVAVNERNREDILITYGPDYEFATFSWPSQIAVTRGADTLTLLTSSTYPGNIVEANLPDGDRIRYEYTGNSLDQVIHINQNNEETITHRYIYEDTRFPGHITGIENENGDRISSVQYDAQGRAISSEKGPLDSGIQRTQIQYDSDGTRTIINALGKQSTYHFTQFNGEYKITQVEGHPSANCAGANQVYTYDSNGFLASKTDWQGNVTTYTHNDRGQENSRTEASGTAQARTITTEWHADFNLPTRIIELEREMVMTYDTQGRLLSREVRPINN